MWSLWQEPAEDANTNQAVTSKEAFNMSGKKKPGCVANLLAFVLLAGLCVWGIKSCGDRVFAPETPEQAARRKEREAKRAEERQQEERADAERWKREGAKQPKLTPAARTRADTKASEPPKLTAADWSYLAYALRYDQCAKEQGRTPPVLFGSTNADVGVFRGRFEVQQVIGPGSLLVDQLGADDLLIPGQRYRVDNLDTSNMADGQTFRFGELLVAYEGNWSYLTVLGAKATVRHVVVLDKYKLEKARQRIVEETQARHRREVQDARDDLAKAETELKSFQEQNQRVADFISASARIRLYEPHAKERPDMAKALEAEQKRLAAVGTVPASEVKAYKTELASLTARLATARAELAKCLNAAAESGVAPGEGPKTDEPKGPALPEVSGEVTVHLKDGKAVTGTVFKSRPESVTLQVSGMALRTCKAAEVKRIEQGGRVLFDADASGGD
jgi:hypothetical protein